MVGAIIERVDGSFFLAPQSSNGTPHICSECGEKNLESVTIFPIRNPHRKPKTICDRHPMRHDGVGGGSWCSFGTRFYEQLMWPTYYRVGMVVDGLFVKGAKMKIQTPMRPTEVERATLIDVLEKWLIKHPIEENLDIEVPS